MALQRISSHFPAPFLGSPATTSALVLALALSLLVAPSGRASAAEMGRGLLPAVKESVPELLGYMDRTGKMLIKPQFFRAHEFSEGLAAVTLEAEGPWGYIDTEGRVVIEPQFDAAFPFTEGRALVQAGGKWGYIDAAGNPVIPSQFDAAFPFTEGRALVQAGGKWGYIDATGNAVIPLQFSDAESFSEGLARVEVNGRWGYVDNLGNLRISPLLSDAGDFKEGFAAVQLDGRWGYIDRTGKTAIAPRFDAAHPFSQRLASVRLGEKWGYIDTAGNLLIPPSFDRAYPFSEGLAAVKPGPDEIWGYIDRSGQFVIPPRFLEAGPFRGGVAWVLFYIDTRGNRIGDLGYSTVGFVAPSDYAALVAASNAAVYAIVRHATAGALGVPGARLAPVAAGLAPLIADLEAKLDVLRTVLPDEGAYLAAHWAILTQLLHLERWSREISRALVADDRDAFTRQVARGRGWLQRLRDLSRGLADEIDATQAETPAASPAPAATAPTLPAPADFNTLTHVLIDRQRKTVSFIGQMDAQGPKVAIPYVQLLSAALRLPEEKGPVGMIGGEPGFSLEPAGETGPPIEELRRDTAAQERALGRYFQARLADDPELAHYSFSQLKPDILDFYRSILTQRMGTRETELLLDQVKGWKDLRELSRRLSARGVVDLEAVDRGVASLMFRRWSTRGNVFLFPPDAMEQLFGKRTTVSPQFFGIPPRSQLARVVMEADYVLKSIAGNSGYRLKEKLPFHQTFAEWWLGRADPTDLRQQAASTTSALMLGAIQIVPARSTVDISEDGSLVSFKDVKLEVRAGSRPGWTMPAFLGSYAQFLTSRYQQYEQTLPELWQLRELVKVIALARYLKTERVEPDLPPDISWSPPAQLPGRYDLAFVGLGDPAPFPAFLPIGGVALQIKDAVAIQQGKGPTDVRPSGGPLTPKSPNAEVRIGGKMLRSHTVGWTPNWTEPVAGRAAGHPIAPADRLSRLEYSDARSALAAMTHKELQDLQQTAREREARLLRGIENIKKKEFQVQLKVASPPDLDGWKARLQEKVLDEIPGLRFMEDLGRRAAARMAEIEKGGGRRPAEARQALEDYRRLTENLTQVQTILRSGADLMDGTTQRRLQALLDVRKENVTLSPSDLSRLVAAKLRDAQQRERLVVKLGFEEARSLDQLSVAALTVAREAWAVYREFSEARDWKDLSVRTAPHLGKILRELLPTAAEVVGYAPELVRPLAKGNVAVRAGELGIDLAYQAADIYLTNEGLREERAANRVLMLDVTSSRLALEHEIHTTRRLQALLDEEHRRR